MWLHTILLYRANFRYTGIVECEHTKCLPPSTIHKRSAHENMATMCISGKWGTKCLCTGAKRTEE